MIRISYFCIVLAFLIPVACAAYIKFKSKNYDNHTPRDYYAKLEGSPKRAYCAQLNAHENFAPFAVGVIIAQQMQVPQSLLNILAISFVVARILYTVFYIVDFHVGRSVAWFTGLTITMSFYVMALTRT